MKKAELIDIVSEKVEGVNKTQVGDIYDAIFETIERAVVEDTKHRYVVNGFGTFKLSHNKEKKGRNPATKEEITIPAYTTIKFSASSAVKERLTKK